MQKWIDQLGRPCLRANFTVESSGDHKRVCCWELLGSECQGLGLGSCGAVYDGDQKGGLEAKARFARPLDSGPWSSACLCDAQHVTQSLFSSHLFGWVIASAHFTSEDLKTTVHFWLLGTWDEPSRIKRQSRKILLSADFQDRPASHQETSPEHL